MKNSNGNKLHSFAIFSLTFVIAIFITILQKGEVPVSKEFPINEPASRTVFSPLHVAFVDEEQTARLKSEKETQVLPIYSLDAKAKRGALGRMDKELKPALAAHPVLKEAEQEKIIKTLTAVLERFLNEGILEDSAKRQLLDSGKTQIQRSIGGGAKPELHSVKDVFNVSEVKERAAFFLEKEGLREKESRDLATDVFNRAIQADLFLDEGHTKELIKQASDSVSPVMLEVKRGEMVTQKGLLVSKKDQDRLIQVQKKMAKKQAQSRVLSVGFFSFLAMVLTFLYLKYFQPKDVYQPKFLILVNSIFLLTLLIEKVTLLIPTSSFYILPGALAAILLTILQRPALGVLGALVISILSAPLAEFRVEITLMLLVGSLTGSFVAHGIRKRIDFLRVGLGLGIANSVVLIGFFLFQEWQLSEAFAVSPLGLANGFLVTALAFFLVPLYEVLFNLTTDITLLELSDLNHPLLKRMVIEAPGTYHHSLVVSTLAEGACEAIGANALLARVGCYFHDIGKIARSEYFTENQTPQSRTRHEKLTPTMSYLVIMSHVKDGVELAKKYKLKDVIIRFIPEHQGKGVIYYFYKKAVDQAAPGENIRADDFRYPGPKPQSRETAVALLADSVEAASRSLKEVNPEAIRSLVRKIINEKFIDGQLDECDLTLKDLHKIQESFVHNLMAIFHTRVSYPNTPKDPYRPDLFESDQFQKFH